MTRLEAARERSGWVKRNFHVNADEDRAWLLERVDELARVARAVMLDETPAGPTYALADEALAALDEEPGLSMEVPVPTEPTIEVVPIEPDPTQPGAWLDLIGVPGVEAITMIPHRYVRLKVVTGTIQPEEKENAQEK